MPGPLEVAIEIDGDMAQQRQHVLVTVGEVLEEVLVQQESQHRRVDPVRVVVLAPELHLSRPDRAPIGKLQAVPPVDPHGIGPDQLELALDLEAALLAELARRRLLRQLARLDPPAGHEELVRQRAGRPLEQEDLTVALGVDDHREGVGHRSPILVHPLLVVPRTHDCEGTGAPGLGKGA